MPRLGHVIIQHHERWHISFPLKTIIGGSSVGFDMTPVEAKASLAIHAGIECSVAGCKENCLHQGIRALVNHFQEKHGYGQDDADLKVLGQVANQIGVMSCCNMCGYGVFKEDMDLHGKQCTRLFSSPATASKVLSNYRVHLTRLAIKRKPTTSDEQVMAKKLRTDHQNNSKCGLSQISSKLTSLMYFCLWCTRSCMSFKFLLKHCTERHQGKISKKLTK